jgi:hypothetical protein
LARPKQAAIAHNETDVFLQGHHPIMVSLILAETLPTLEMCEQTGAVSIKS